ncbi:hypothetical protein CCY99_02240 [Helicobacter sp. 16-1353]|nr:hypothetical protein CCY99_02240 [Helicobacter sp. 16-1353]
MEKYQIVDFIAENGSTYKLEEYEIFFIRAKDEYIGDYLTNIINTSNCDVITQNELKNLEVFLCFYKK